MTSPESNPVGFLQETVRKINVAAFPTYEESGASGPDHSRLFTCKCMYHGFEVSGTATTKKQAKTEASKHMIELLQENGYFEKYKLNIGASVIPETRNLNINIVSSLGCTPNKNPISILQEYCQGKKQNPPNYTEHVNSSGNFVFECHLGDKKTYGEAICKKSSKIEAAHKMCKILNLLNTPSEDSNIKINENPEINVASKYKMLRGPLPVIDITRSLQEFKFPDEPEDALIQTSAETLNLDDSLVEVEPNTNKDESQNAKIKVEASVEPVKNYISIVQEYCQKNRIPIPEYKEAGFVNGVFVCDCHLGDRMTSGQANSKKGSKTEAARKMCEILKLINFTREHPNIEIKEEAEESFASRYQRIEELLPAPDVACVLEEFKLAKDESEE